MIILPKILTFLIPILFLSPVFSTNITINFQSFLLRNFTLIGDSYLRNGVVGLTRDTSVPSTSSGAVIYNAPIKLFDPVTNTTASFASKFSFSITTVNPSSFGDGFAFFLSPENHTVGTPGLSFGLLNSSSSDTNLSKSSFVAVEFDTRFDPGLRDPNGNHVGLDLDSLVSIKTSDLILQDMHLKSGNTITAWIEYKHDINLLRVYLSYSSLKPSDPVLSSAIDLTGHLKESMYAGFSASTDGSTELHLVENWTFQTFGFPQITPTSHPHNVSDHSVALAPPVISVVPSSNPRNKLVLGLGIAGPGICFVALVVFGYISLRKYIGMKMEQNLKAEILTGPKEFSYRELKSATKGFHSSRVIGHGAFGTVYKAFFVSTGTIAAVKRSKHTHEGKTEFLAELSIIACLRHKNLLQLQGWCVEKGEWLLVYEFMPNGSLDAVLYQESGNRTPLKWTHRYNIAVGMASALAYLHQECEQQVIHRDIKTSNILLDGNYNPRLGDFGLARIMDHGMSPVSTLTAGTMGYLAPEYLQYGIATDKTDVFSYGVVILELTCGRRPIEKDLNNQNMVNLVDWVWGLYSEGNIIKAADKRLNGEFKVQDMKKLLLIGLSCANPDASERPNMRRVLQILKCEAKPVLVPKTKPTLTFSNSLPVSLDEIVSDGEDEKVSAPNSPFEIRIS
ncbi:unnamed protein product [Rhodiola kirilowii]